jgi:hypothetical protein
MKRRLPTSDQCNKFVELIKDTKEREVKRYLIRSYQAFKDGHLEAAVILAWGGIERYPTLVKEHIGKWFFDWHWKEITRRQDVPKNWSFEDYERISDKIGFWEIF